MSSIVGAGFGGTLCRAGTCRRGGCAITIIDQRNHHLFQPLLYQVATAALATLGNRLGRFDYFLMRKKREEVTTLLGTVSGDRYPESAA